MTDLRRLPGPVLERLKASPVDLSQRTPGFDISYRGRTLEWRAQRKLELRTDENGAPVLTGYASVWNFPYDVLGGAASGWGWEEQTMPGSAKRSIMNRDNVRLLFDHEGLPLGTTSARTLAVTDDDMGLLSRATPDPQSQYSMEVVRRVERGELDAMSYAFEVLDEEWNDDYTKRWIKEVRLWDVSVVNYPANPATFVGLEAAPAGDDGARSRRQRDLDLLTLATASLS